MSLKKIFSLKKMMGAIKTIKDQGTSLQFQIDQLGETLRYMGLHEMGKLDALNRKLNDVSDAFRAAEKAAPTVAKQIKPMRDAEAATVLADIGRMQERLESNHKKHLTSAAFVAKTGCAEGYKLLNSASLEVSQDEQDTQRLYDLANLFEFGEKAEPITEEVRSMRRDLVFGKSIWDITKIM